MNQFLAEELSTDALPINRQDLFADQCLLARPLDVIEFRCELRGSGKTWALLNQANLLSSGDTPLQGLLLGNQWLKDAAVRQLKTAEYRPSRSQFLFQNGSRIRLTDFSDWHRGSIGIKADWIGIDVGSGAWPNDTDLSDVKGHLKPTGIRRIMIVGG